MDRLSCVHEGAAYSETLHGRDHLLPHQAALAHTADDKLAASLIETGNQFNCAEQAFSGDWICFVQDANLCKGGCGGREDVDGARKQTRPLSNRWY